MDFKPIYIVDTLAVKPAHQMAMLSLLVLSVAFMAYAFFFQPVMLVGKQFFSTLIHFVDLCTYFLVYQF